MFIQKSVFKSAREGLPYWTCPSAPWYCSDQAHALKHSVHCPFSPSGFLSNCGWSVELPKLYPSAQPPAPLLQIQTDPVLQTQKRKERKKERKTKNGIITGFPMINNSWLHTELISSVLCQPLTFSTHCFQLFLHS